MEYAWQQDIEEREEEIYMNVWRTKVKIYKKGNWVRKKRLIANRTRARNLRGDTVRVRFFF